MKRIIGAVAAVLAVGRSRNHLALATLAHQPDYRAGACAAGTGAASGCTLGLARRNAITLVR